MIKRIDECKNSFEESSTEKVSNHIPTSMIWTSCGTYKKDDVYRGEDYMKKSYESLREHAIKITLKRKLSNFQQV